MSLLTLLGAGCLLSRGTAPTSEAPTPAVTSPTETDTSEEPSDPIDAEVYDDASIVEAEDRQLGELDRAGSLHEADVGSLEDAFAEESVDDARTID